MDLVYLLNIILCFIATVGMIRIITAPGGPIR